MASEGLNPGRVLMLVAVDRRQQLHLRGALGRYPQGTLPAIPKDGRPGERLYVSSPRQGGSRHQRPLASVSQLLDGPAQNRGKSRLIDATTLSLVCRGGVRGAAAADIVKSYVLIYIEPCYHGGIGCQAVKTRRNREVCGVYGVRRRSCLLSSTSSDVHHTFLAEQGLASLNAPFGVK